MTRIGILGANGQVGAEVTLLLAREPGVTVVPICRNALGSAFLRSRGIACRHGSIADARQGARLLGDCDVVANFALAIGNPRTARLANDAVIRSAAAAAPMNARIVYFSTMSVYGDPRPGHARVVNSYGREKRHGERRAIRAGRRHGRETWVLRLRHVCGDLQGMTADVRSALARGSVALPDGGSHTSNTVYTATIVDSLLSIASGRERPGVYDLMCSPPWTWREVFEYEARRIGVPLVVESVSGPRPDSLADAMRRSLRRAAGSSLASERVRERARTLLAYLPTRLGLRGEAAYHARRAMDDAALLTRPAPVPDHLSWRPQGHRWLAGLTPTVDVLSRTPDLTDGRDVAVPFPPDLPDAESA